MVVLVVIGLLSGLAVVKYNTFQRQAELRSSAQKLYQIFGWARLESEKRGDTLLVRLSTFPEVSVYVDQNGDGFVNQGEPRLLMDSLARSVRVFKPAKAPPPTIDPTGGFAQGSGSCNSRNCCSRFGEDGFPTWDVPVLKNAGVAVCARNLPRMPSDIEDGAIYLESAESGVKEKWAVVMAKVTSKNPSLWTATKAPSAPTDWSQKR